MHEKLKVYAATLTAVTFWGLSYIWSNRLLQQGIPVEYFLPIRIFLAACILLVVNLACGFSMKIHKDDVRNFLLLAICEPFIYFFLTLCQAFLPTALCVRREHRLSPLFDGGLKLSDLFS